MSLQIYNSLTRKKEAFTPLQPGKISMYVCGITVYDYCHLGHGRLLAVFDVVSRFLRSQGWDLTYVRNITDIDDKILARAAERGEDYQELTRHFIEAMLEDETRLGILRPDIEPRATDHINEIIVMIQQLLDKGHAYLASNGDVYYRVASFETYGRLSNKNLDDLLAGARVEVDDAKEDPRDFALWKNAQAGEVGWDTPWGRGRPGWHIECSAMSKGCLGATFDIHGGGPDLPFPHHENEIAQSEAANGCKYVNYWMHAGALRVDGEKMSKSLGNFFTLREVLKSYHPEVIRYLLISSHYRSPINYSEDSLIEARAGLERFYATLRHYSDVLPIGLEELTDSPNYQQFVRAMNDDFNTRQALAVMYDLVREVNSIADAQPEQAHALVGELKAMAGILGILQEDPQSFLHAGAADAISAEHIERLVAERAQAKKDKQYARADEIRASLLEQGVVLEDSPAGTQWRREQSQSK
ncbi:cysteine--tRNA ligase [Marinimicrobium sp. ABcell2]|uniref:cysteine--tRNA ligase n=1 Tax=Marinimicrobium sp. ABcell2 TaxID=3069751 RepID=UPI0027B35872|nr:cysteine--tRNA ligase [Marinimicrobium sp. ABcell2]MDQ2075681.1 cysteine--tRNA ligase [Marinimicrobium sp. ABcell2]